MLQLFQTLYGRGHVSTAVGMASPIIGAIVSLFKSIEDWARLTSVLVGLAIGCVVLYKKIRDINKKDSNE